jgi:hypothetical protein
MTRQKLAPSFHYNRYVSPASLRTRSARIGRQSHLARPCDPISHIYSFCHSAIKPFVHSAIHSAIHPSIHPFMYSFSNPQKSKTSNLTLSCFMTNKNNYYIKQQSHFLDYRIERATNNDEISLEVSLKNLSKGLKSAEQADACVMKLARKNGLPCLSIVAETMSAIQITQDVPVSRILSESEMLDFREPTLPEPAISLHLPDVRRLVDLQYKLYFSCFLSSYGQRHSRAFTYIHIPIHTHTHTHNIHIHIHIHITYAYTYT